MKKLFKNTAIVISFLLIFSTCFPHFVKAAGTENAQSDVSGIYIETTPVSNKILTYAKDNFSIVAASIYDSIQTGDIVGSRSADICFGEPFTINSIAYFPVMQKSGIIALLAIIDDAYLSWSLSRGFSSSLNDLKYTEKNSPAKLVTERGNIFALCKGNKYQLTNYPQTSSVDASVDRNMGTTVNLRKIIHIERNRLHRKLISLRNTPYKNLSLDLKEVQGEDNWCAAYSEAAILRYMGYANVYAPSIIHFFYPSSPKPALECLSDTNVIDYANLKGSHPRYSAGTLLDSQVRKEIDNSRPIYLKCQGNEAAHKDWHAVVLRGYNVNQMTYSIWNPWEQCYVTISRTGRRFAGNGGYFTWKETIYDW